MYNYNKSVILKKEIATIKMMSFEPKINDRLIATVTQAIESLELQNSQPLEEQKYMHHEDVLFKSLATYSTLYLFTYLYLTNRLNLININFEEIPYGLRGEMIHLIEASSQKTKADVLKVFMAHYDSHTKDNLSMMD